VKKGFQGEEMTYLEAVALMTAETKKEHDERCFETGHCDLENEIDLALVNVRRARIVEAEKVIGGHLRQYDSEQITPRKAG
jgi:hypothetical protein